MFREEDDKEWSEKWYERDAQKEAFKMIGERNEPARNDELYERYSDYATDYTNMSEDERETLRREIDDIEKQQKERNKKSFKQSFNTIYSNENEETVPEDDTYSENDKILWPEKLSEKNIEFDEDNITPRQKRILQKQIRKNPEWLSKKEDSSTVRLAVRDTTGEEDAFGYITPINDRNEKYERGDKNLLRSKYYMALSNDQFQQKYDPKFEEYVRNQNDGELFEDKHMERLADSQQFAHQNTLTGGILYITPARHDLSRTMGHEFQHVEQVEKEDGNFESFQKIYNEDPYYYEGDAHTYAAFQKDVRENRNPEPDEYSKDSQLRGVYRDNNKIFFTKPQEDPDTVFVNIKHLDKIQPETEEDFEMISNMISHEEMHNTLYKEHDYKTSSKLDAVTPVGVEDDGGNIINKEDVATLGTPTEVRFKTINNLNKKTPEDADERVQQYREYENARKVNETYDKFKNR